MKRLINRKKVIINGRVHHKTYQGRTEVHLRTIRGKRRYVPVSGSGILDDILGGINSLIDSPLGEVGVKLLNNQLSSRRAGTINNAQLAGTINNAQLAGSINNNQLAGKINNNELVGSVKKDGKEFLDVLGLGVKEKKVKRETILDEIDKQMKKKTKEIKFLMI